MHLTWFLHLEIYAEVGKLINLADSSIRLKIDSRKCIFCFLLLVVSLSLGGFEMQIWLWLVYVEVLEEIYTTKYYFENFKWT